MRRWVCPSCSGGVNAPERPRRDDVRRYCLDCSAETGRLVERTCPALDKVRAARDATNKERAKARAQREREDFIERYTVKRNGKPLNLWTVFDKVRRLPSFQPYSRRRIDLHIRRGKPTNRAGYAWHYGINGAINIAAKTTWDADPIDTLIHEFAHLLAWWRDRGKGHGRAFRNAYHQLASEWNARHEPKIKIDRRWTP